MNNPIIEAAQQLLDSKGLNAKEIARIRSDECIERKEFRSRNRNTYSELILA